MPEVVDLGTLGGSSSQAHDINESGTVAGEAETADGRTHAVSWDRQGRITELGGIVDNGYSTAYVINDRGVAIGLSGPLWGPVHATLWRW